MNVQGALEYVQAEHARLAKEHAMLVGMQDWQGKKLAQLGNVVADFVDHHQDELVICGARALNHYLPPHQRVDTEDWDVFLVDSSLANLTRLTELALAHLQSHFPQRQVWQKSAQNNPDGSRTIFVSHRHCLDISLSPASLQHTPGASHVPLAWLFNNLQAMVVNQNARYRWEKDRQRLIRWCWADANGANQLPTRERQRILESAQLTSPVQVRRLEQELEAQRRGFVELSAALALSRQEHSHCGQLAKLLASLQEEKSAQARQLAKVLASLQEEKSAQARQLTQQAAQQGIFAQELKELHQRNTELSAQLKTQGAELRAKEASLRLAQKQAQQTERRSTSQRTENELKLSQNELRLSQLAGELELARARVRELEAETSAKDKKVVHFRATADRMVGEVVQLKRISLQLREHLSHADEEHRQLLGRYYQLRSGFEWYFVKNTQVDALWVAERLEQEAAVAEGEACWEVLVDGQVRRVFMCSTCKPSGRPFGLVSAGGLNMPMTERGSDYQICADCVYIATLSARE